MSLFTHYASRRALLDVPLYKKTQSSAPSMTLPLPDDLFSPVLKDQQEQHQVTSPTSDMYSPPMTIEQKYSLIVGGSPVEPDDPLVPEDQNHHSNRVCDCGKENMCPVTGNCGVCSTKQRRNRVRRVCGPVVPSPDRDRRQPLRELWSSSNSNIPAPNNRLGHPYHHQPVNAPATRVYNGGVQRPVRTAMVRSSAPPTSRNNNVVVDSRRVNINNANTMFMNNFF